MSNGELISREATCKHRLQVAYEGAVVAQSATTAQHCNRWEYGKPAQAERIAFERYESFDAQRREQLAAGEPSEIAELEQIAETSRALKRKERHD